MSTQKTRRGFTLVELLVAVSIIGLLMSLGYSGYNMVLDSSRRQVTRTLLSQLDAGLRERINNFHNMSQGTASQTLANRPTIPLGGGFHKRAVLIDRIWAMRCSFPQYFYECMKRELDSDKQAGDVYGNYRGMSLGAHGFRMQQIIYFRYLTLTSRPGETEQQMSAERPFNKAIAYSPVPEGHDPRTESSECLYLILSTQVASEEFTVDQIPEQFIQDSDGDGLLEIVDAWGTPLQFYRWPTDYVAYLLETGKLPQSILIRSDPNDPNSPVLANNLDTEGLLTSDYNQKTNSWFKSERRAKFENGMANDNLRFAFFRVSKTDDPNTPFAYPILPMIVSAGPDREFGLHGTQDATTTPQWDDEFARLGRVLRNQDGTYVTEVEDNMLSLPLPDNRRPVKTAK